MEHFTPVASLVGGVIIGLAAALLLLFNGRICGISGIFGGLLSAKRDETLWRFVFVAGLFAGGVLLRFVYPQAFNIEIDRSAAAIVLAGLLVGVGTRMGSGCTSGHGI
ncbi:MAG: YeeE/YedE family protein, partial [Candidatus Binatia bacterium]